MQLRLHMLSHGKRCLKDELAVDKFNICMRAHVRAHYAGVRARAMNSTTSMGGNYD